MTETMELPEVFDCAECGNAVQSGVVTDHHSDCPVITNWWTIEYGSEQLCYLCNGWLMEGDHYRMIPLHIDTDEDEGLEAALGSVLLEDRPVCQPCSSFSLIRGGKVDAGA